MEAWLIHIKQDDPYNDYMKKILNYLALLSKMAESILIDLFVTGLELTMQAKVVSRHPKMLKGCMKSKW